MRTVLLVSSLVIALVVGVAVPASADGPAYQADEVTQVAVGGDSYACGVRPGGQVACWGQHAGPGKTRPAFEAFTQVDVVDATLDGAGCGIRTDGALRCWHTGEPGLTVPVSGSFTDVAGDRSWCGIRANGRLACWGEQATTPPSGSYTDVEVGYGACAIRANGTVRCWGGFDEDLEDVPSGTFTDIAVGSRHACGVRPNGDVTCWGSSNSTIMAAPAVKMTEIDAWGNHTCGVKQADGGLVCWGERLPYPGTPPAGSFVDVATGYAAACAVRADGTTACWGVIGSGIPAGPLWFSDVPTSSPFFADIGWLADNGLTFGYDDGTFNAGGSMSRQAMAAFLWRLEGEPEVPDNAPTFLDVPPNHPYATAIRWLSHAGITSGYEDGTFQPAAPVSRQAMAAFLWRAAGEPGTGSAAFSDVPDGHAFAEPIAWMAGAGISEGYADGTFRPGADVSRQAMAAFVHRFVDGR